MFPGSIFITTIKYIQILIKKNLYIHCLALPHLSNCVRREDHLRFPLMICWDFLPAARIRDANSSHTDCISRGQSCGRYLHGRHKCDTEECPGNERKRLI